MKNKKVLKLTILLAVLFTFLSAGSVLAANKAACIPVSVSGRPQTPDYQPGPSNSYVLELMPTATAKLKKSNALGIRLLIPKAFFTAIGDNVRIELECFYYTKVQKDLEIVGDLDAQYMYAAEMTSEGVKLAVINSSGSVQYSGILNESGNYYVVNLTRAPMNTRAYLYAKGSAGKINTKKAFILQPTLTVTVDTAAASKGNILVDQLNVFTAKTIKIPFSKKNFSNLYIYNLAKENMKTNRIVVVG